MERKRRFTAENRIRQREGKLFMKRKQVGRKKHETGGMDGAAALGGPCPLCSRGSKRYETSFLDVFDVFTGGELCGFAGGCAPRKFLQTVHDELKVYHRRSIFIRLTSVNNLYMNQNAGIAPVAVEPALYDLLTFSEKIYRSNRRQNQYRWAACFPSGTNTGTGAGRSGTAVPSAEELYRAGEHTDIDQMLLDPEKRPSI